MLVDKEEGIHKEMMLNCLNFLKTKKVVQMAIPPHKHKKHFCTEYVSVRLKVPKLLGFVFCQFQKCN